MRQPIIAVAAALVFFVVTGFQLDNATIPKEEILSGGVPKDGIPALLNPQFVTAAKAGFLEPDDRVIGIKRGAETKAYPLRILNWHEVVNDTIGGTPVAVTF